MHAIQIVTQHSSKNIRYIVLSLQFIIIEFNQRKSHINKC